MSKKNKKLNKKELSAFTLVELMVAIFVFSVILLASISVTNTYLKTRIALKKQQQATEELSVVLGDMAKKIRMSSCDFPPGGGQCVFEPTELVVYGSAVGKVKYILEPVRNVLKDDNNRIVAEDVNVNFSYSNISPYPASGVLTQIPRITISINKTEFPETILQTTVSMRSGYESSSTQRARALAKTSLGTSLATSSEASSEIPPGMLTGPLIGTPPGMPSGTLPGVSAGARSVVLARVEVDRMLSEFNVPVLAVQVDDTDREWALVKAPEKNIIAAGLEYRVLDPKPTETYLIIHNQLRLQSKFVGVKSFQTAKASSNTVYSDSKITIARNTGQRGNLSEKGLLTVEADEPIVLREANFFNEEVKYDSDVAAMIGDVSRSELEEKLKGLSGEIHITVGKNKSYTLRGRDTCSTMSMEKASQYLYESCLAMGLNARYQYWSNPDACPWYPERTYPNVICEKNGGANAGEIVLLGAHFDAVQGAPGADDNGTGSVALLAAAKIMASRNFDRTLRFAFFSGEEQGIFGSTAYANEVSGAGENIVAALSLDMIGWDRKDGPIVNVYTRIRKHAGYEADQKIVDTMTKVVSEYGLGLSVRKVSTGFSSSDHSPFWKKGYPAVLVIEPLEGDPNEDFNEYYHDPGDTTDKINFAYFTENVKAALGTAAHLAM